MNAVIIWITVYVKDAKDLLAIDESCITKGLGLKSMISLSIPAWHQVPADTAYIL